MEDIKLPAYPCVDSYESGNVFTASAGFSKLELASLMIAQGLMADGFNPIDSITFASECVTIAKAVLEQANK